MTMSGTRNLLLARLEGPEQARVAPHIRLEELSFKQTLYEEGQVVEKVYFPEVGVVSMVAVVENGQSIETGTAGNEGLAGLPAVLGVRHSPARVFCQIPGHASVLPASVIARERERASAWFFLLLRYVNFVAAMAAQTSACNRLHDVTARMSRWLLMTHDRVDSDNFPLTQDFLSVMLGVARPTVNIAGATLQRAGLIKYSRGRIAVLDRTGLEAAACVCYELIRDELDKSLNDAVPRKQAVIGRMRRAPATGARPRRIRKSAVKVATAAQISRQVRRAQR